MTSRNVTEHRDRFSIYRLCDCPTCGGSGKEYVVDGASFPAARPKRCPDCRGEGKIRDEIATADSAEAVGVALVLLAEEGEFEECPLGLLDRRPECAKCEGSGKEYLIEITGEWIATGKRCPECKGTGTKQTGTWLVKPWGPSPRNVHDAAVTLAKSKKSDRVTR